MPSISRRSMILAGLSAAVAAPAAASAPVPLSPLLGLLAAHADAMEQYAGADAALEQARLHGGKAAIDEAWGRVYGIGKVMLAIEDEIIDHHPADMGEVAAKVTWMLDTPAFDGVEELVVRFARSLIGRAASGLRALRPPRVPGSQLDCEWSRATQIRTKPGQTRDKLRTNTGQANSGRDAEVCVSSSHFLINPTAGLCHRTSDGSEAP